jgi:HK97 family phage prohead protease
MSEVFYRHATLTREQKPDEDGMLRLIASTDAPVDMGGWREVLVHEPDSIDMDSATALLFNHRSGHIVGALDDKQVEGGKLAATARLLDGAAAEGVLIADMISKGALRGFSAGYTYSMGDVEDDRETRTRRVKKWRLLEISLTPIPADKHATLRAMPVAFQEDNIEPQADEAAEEGGHRMSDTQNPEPVQPGPNQADPITRDAGDYKARAKYCEDNGISVVEHFERSMDELKDIVIAKMRKELEEKASEPKGPVVTVKKDGIDNRADAIRDAAEHMFGVADGQDKGMRNASILDLGREFLGMQGRTAPMSRFQLGQEMISAKRDAANVLSTDFTTYVLANVMDKAVLKGYMNARQTWRQWCGIRSVPDFKSFTGGALDVGNLVETAASVAFPELAKAEDGYNAALKMWGVTANLSFQAYVNDDLGEFSKMLRQAGAIAARTIEKQVYSTLNSATWTNHTTVTGDLGTAGNLGKGVQAFMDRSGPAGEKIDLEPRFLLLPVGLYETGMKQTVQVQGATERQVNDFLTPVVTAQLTTAATAANSTYYLAADPNEADTLIVAFLQGVDSPMTQEYDAGAVAARKWKIMQPFVPVLPAGFVGLHRCTQA